MNNVIRFPATYRKDLPEEYHGNPFVEALYDMYGIKEYYGLIMNLPSFDKTYQNESVHMRKVKIVELYKYVVPEIEYYNLYKTLWRMLFSTYAQRNCFDTKVVGKQYEYLLLKQQMDAAWQSTIGESLLITAPSGFGKTMKIKRVLHSLTQVIDHTEYNGEKFEQAQILWIYIKIPSNAARKSLCHLFLEQVDICVGTTYSTDNNENTKIGTYEAIFRTIIETYKLGFLVIDEMQNLSVAKAGGDEEFLNFFSNLAEQWSMGLVLIGTPDTIPIITQTFTASRRLTSGGDKHYERYQQDDPIWESLVMTLWRYQYTNSPKELYKNTKEGREITDHRLYEEIYKMTQGIPFIFTFLFIHAQFIAIDEPKSDGTEQVTIKVFRRAYNESSTLIKAAVEDMRLTNGKNYTDLMGAAHYEASSARTKLLVDIEFLISKKSLPPKTLTELRKMVADLEEKYVLNEKEQKIIDTAKLCLPSKPHGASNIVIDGECEVVDS
jgi:hypothetical protein